MQLAEDQKHREPIFEDEVGGVNWTLTFQAQTRKQPTLIIQKTREARLHFQQLASKFKEAKKNPKKLDLRKTDLGPRSESCDKLVGDVREEFLIGTGSKFVWKPANEFQNVKFSQFY